MCGGGGGGGVGEKEARDTCSESGAHANLIKGNIEDIQNFALKV